MVTDIVRRLIEGERFSFDELKPHVAELYEFWNHWWAGADMTKLGRPCTLNDADPILEKTENKAYVETSKHGEMFGDPLITLLMKQKLPLGKPKRSVFVKAMIEHLVTLSPKLDEPMVIFAGGGYGAGKTSTLQFLSCKNKLPFNAPLGPKSLQGVDYCKQLIPEFNLVRQVYDGRASEICQDESRDISNKLFARLLKEKRSFAWDSSMSHPDDTNKKIDTAISKGYRTGMVAVLTEVSLAITRAMERAKMRRRFAHPLYLENSHRAFWGNLQSYIDKMDEALVVENSGKKDEMVLLLQKTAKNGEVKVFDELLFETYCPSNLTEEI